MWRKIAACRVWLYSVKSDQTIKVEPFSPTATIYLLHHREGSATDRYCLTSTPFHKIKFS